MRFFKQLSLISLVMVVSMPSMAGNILADESDNDVYNGATVRTLTNGDFGLQAPGYASPDFWRQKNVSVGDLIYAATGLPAEDTALAIYKNDGSANVDSIAPAKPNTDADSGQGLSAAIAGLTAEAPGNLFFEVSGGAAYQVCTVVADSSDVGAEGETVSNKNDLANNATPYTNAVMSGSYDEVDYYSFSAVAGSRVMVILNNDPDRTKVLAAQVTPLIEIVDADDMALAAFTENVTTVAAATPSYLVPKTGTYFVRIKEDNGVATATGDYDFVICGATVGTPSPNEGEIGDFVWFDRNDDGLQDTNEPGIKGMKVDLLDIAMQKVRTTKTRKDGSYSFKLVPNGTYFVQVAPPLGAEIGMQNTGDDKLDSDAAAVTGITDPVVVSGGLGSVNTDIALRPKDVPACDAAPQAGNDSALKVGFKHANEKSLKLKGKKATINPADIAGSTWVKLCVYYDGALAVESYVGVGDPGLSFKNGTLRYKSRNTNVTGLKSVVIKPGTSKAKYKVKMSGIGSSPQAAVSTVDVNLITSAGLTISEQLTAGQIRQKGNKLKAKAK